MPVMMLRPLAEGVMEAVVPGQTRISPPRSNFRIAVSPPAVMADPDDTLLPAAFPTRTFPLTRVVLARAWGKPMPMLPSTAAAGWVGLGGAGCALRRWTTKATPFGS